MSVQLFDAYGLFLIALGVVLLVIWSRARREAARRDADDAHQDDDDGAPGPN